MSGYSPSFRKYIENRIKSGSLKVSGKPQELPVSVCAGASDSVIGNVRQSAGNDALTRMRALGRMKKGKMNDTELAYSQYLEALKACGEVLWWAFEAIKLRLADNTYYEVDFFVMKSSGQLEAHEVKGYAMDDSMVKLKVADELFPFRFLLIKAANKHCTRWNVKEIGNRN